jgi:hypothetical protein
MRRRIFYISWVSTGEEKQKGQEGQRENFFAEDVSDEKGVWRGQRGVTGRLSRGEVAWGV